MPANLSIKNVPDNVLERLRKRAKRHHRSLQGELMSILEEVVNKKTLSMEDIYHRGRELGVETGDDSVRMIREDRDAR